MPPLELITLDMTGTLLGFTAPVMHQYAKIALRHGVKSDIEQLEGNFKKSWKMLSAKHPNFGRDSGIGWQNWWRLLVIDTFGHQESKAISLVADDLIRHFETDQAWCLNNGAIELLRTLKENNYTLGVISNFDPRLHTIMKNLKVSSFFSFVLTSYEAGFAKPDRRIFEKALEVSGARQLVHVGNDRVLDFEAARAAGFQGVLVDWQRRIEDLKFPLKVDTLESVPSSLKCLLSCKWAF